IDRLEDDGLRPVRGGVVQAAAQQDRVLVLRVLDPVDLPLDMGTLLLQERQRRRRIGVKEGFAHSDYSPLGISTCKMPSTWISPISPTATASILFTWFSSAVLAASPVPRSWLSSSAPVVSMTTWTGAPLGAPPTPLAYIRPRRRIDAVSPTA